MNKPLVILRELQKGRILRIGQNNYCLDEENYLCTTATNITTDERVLFKVNFGIELKDFLDFCEQVSVEDMDNIILNSVIKDK
jgi:hypothetical protein